MVFTKNTVVSFVIVCVHVCVSVCVGKMGSEIVSNILYLHTLNVCAVNINTGAPTAISRSKEWETCNFFYFYFVLFMDS